MNTLNQKQQLVLDYLNSKNGEQFSATQIGVVVGKKNPKSASIWAKPILEKLRDSGEVKEVLDGKRVKWTVVSQDNSNQEEVEILDVEVEEVSEDKGEEVTDNNIVEEKVDQKDEKPTEDSKDGSELPEKLIKGTEKSMFYNVKTSVVIADAKLAIEEAEKGLEEGKVLSDLEKSRIVRDSVDATLQKRYGFKAISLFDKRTKALKHKVAKIMFPKSIRSKKEVDNTDTHFIPNHTKVEFEPHKLSSMKGKQVGVVKSEFINDFGFRYLKVQVVQKDGTKKNVTVRDANVTVVE